ncbi:uncharacterized protein BP5553_00329 [Venustampulla echinocandica]|uniref:Uncharacterized protein n=1 Tax=Venustampulla echinocandica TaxID=2656787 RepID=A0A370TXW4_9HELO|nr:uncharacterized protein BP5553_00329 [Venustampulla echinocandica]RDL40350.1 hypothetical protein BP5553_00329 [Venustampulla echinocandica]
MSVLGSSVAEMNAARNATNDGTGAPGLRNNGTPDNSAPIEIYLRTILLLNHANTGS